MIKTYDSPQAAYVEHTPKIYFTGAAAWGKAPSAKTYDETEAAWVERLEKKYNVSLSASDAAYEVASNQIIYSQTLFYLDVKPTNKSYTVKASITGRFNNPVVSGKFTYGNSDKYELSGENYYSHDAVDWKVKGYLNGQQITSVTVASGSDYRTSTVFDKEFSKTLSGEFDEITLECVVASYSSTWQLYGMIYTRMLDFAIDGALCYGNDSI